MIKIESALIIKQLAQPSGTKLCPIRHYTLYFAMSLFISHFSIINKETHHTYIGMIKLRP